MALTYMNHTRVLFVNAHFAAHDHKVAQRQADYLRIKAGLFNTKEEPGGHVMAPVACGVLNRLDVQQHIANMSAFTKLSAFKHVSKNILMCSSSGSLHHDC